MKITKKIWSRGVLMEVKEFKDIEHAFNDTTDDVRDIVGRLVECIYDDDRARTKAEALSYILGYGYEVEE